MKVKNNYISHLGFGTVRVLPGEIVDLRTLPKGYGENHPVVKFYLSRGWLAFIKKEDVKINTDPPEKPIERMSKDELQLLAQELKVDFAETDTQKILVDKIKAAKNA